MSVGLLSNAGADPMAPYFAMQAGNIRAYEEPHPPGSLLSVSPGV